MRNKIALLISAALTAAIIVVIGGVLFVSSNIEPASAQSSQEAAGQVITGLDPALQQQLNDREAAYRQLIDEANSRLKQAQEENAKLQAQLDNLTNGNASTQQGISPQQAADVAAAFLGQNNIFAVDTLNQNGMSLFQVTFSSGDRVFVDLNGQVIAASLSQATFNARSGNQGFLEDHEGEHDDN